MVVERYRNPRLQSNVTKLKEEFRVDLRQGPLLLAFPFGFLRPWPRPQLILQLPNRRRSLIPNLKMPLKRVMEGNDPLLRSVLALNESA